MTPPCWQDNSQQQARQSSATSQQWVYDEAKDIEVIGPQWTSSIVEIEPESTESVQRRIRLIAQSSRRGKRSEEDQELITELSHQVEVAHDQAVTSVNNFANNLANNRQVARSQTVFRRQRVAIDDNLIIKSRQLTATVARREAEMVELHERHEAIYIRKEAVIAEREERDRATTHHSV